MFTFTIEEIHEMLDTLEDAAIEIEESSGDPIDAANLPLLSSIVSQLADYSRSGSDVQGLNVSPTILGRFTKFRGKVSRKDALLVVERVRSFLRSEDQQFKEPKRKRKTVAASSLALPPMTFTASKWVMVQSGSDAKQKIAAIATLLDSIIRQTKGANLPENEQILTAIERAQLIAILETALAVLRSPIIETGIMKKASDSLKKAAADAAEKGVQEGVSIMMTAAIHRIFDLLKAIGLS
jgi:hypothetical protein